MRLLLLAALTACKSREPAPVVVDQPASPATRPAPATPAMPATLSSSWLRDLPPPASTKPRSVGGPKLVVGGYEDLLGSFAIDTNGDVYVVDSKRELPEQEIVVQPAGSAAPRVLVQTHRLPTRTEELFDVVVDATQLYFTSNVRTGDAAKVAFALRAVPKAGGTARVVVRRDLAANGLATDLLHDDTDLFLLVVGDEPGAAPYAGSIVRIAKAGGDPVRVATNIVGHYPFAIDDRFLYYEAQQPRTEGSAQRPGALVRVPKPGGAPETLVRTTDSVGEIAVDTSYILYTEPADGLLAIYRVPKAGGSREEVARFDGFPTGISVDRGIVYWASLAEDVHAPAQLFARTFASAKMPPARNTGATLSRGANWLVREGTLFVSLSNGVARTQL